MEYYGPYVAQFAFSLPWGMEWRRKASAMSFWRLSITFIRRRCGCRRLRWRRTSFPTNDESDGVDTVLKLILSKSIGRGYQWQRVHLNISWNYNSDAHEDERENYFAGIIGYDRLIGPDTVLVLDFVREQEKEEGRDSNLLEAGIRYRLTPLVVAPHCIMCKRGVDDGRRGRRHR